MKTKEITSKKLFREYLVEIPYHEVDHSINVKINEMIPNVDISGFRKGKAPHNIVKTKYENSVLSEVIEKIVKDKIEILLQENKLKPFRQPKVTLQKYEKNKPLEINIKIDLQPQIDIYPFDKIKLTKYKINIDKKTIDQNYKSFLDSQFIYKKINSNRSIKLSDKIIVNISTKNQTVPDFLLSQKDVSIVTDSDYQILPDISSKLIDKKAKIGDELKIKFDLKKILKEVKEKNVDFNITITSIEEKSKLEINDDFLKKNKLKNENQLKQNVTERLNTQYENYLREIEKKQLMDILESKNNFDIPEGMLQEEYDIIWHRVEHAKKDNKLDEDDKKLSEEKLKERYKKISYRRVKLAILMQYIANNEKINVSEKELTDGMLNYASQYPGKEKEIFEYFKKNPSSIETIRGPIFEQKIVDLILLKTKLETKDISVKDFVKLQTETFNFNKEKQ